VSFTNFDGKMLFGMLCCSLQELRGMCLTGADRFIEAPEMYEVEEVPRGRSSDGLQ